MRKRLVPVVVAGTALTYHLYYFDHPPRYTIASHEYSSDVRLTDASRATTNFQESKATSLLTRKTRTKNRKQRTKTGSDALHLPG